jgi:hypothetical protein
MHRTPNPLAAISLCCLLLAGCRVDEHKDGKGGDNVNIRTPFGSTSIKTGEGTAPADLGITAYPGAVPVKEDNGKDNNSADVNLSFGDFHFGVKTVSLQTPDPQDKVLAFYRKDLARYGEVIECHNGEPVGQPTETGQGLTCSDHGKNHGTQGGLQLRAGSERHRHIVEVKLKNGSTHIGLILLDTPTNFSDKGKVPE